MNTELAMAALEDAKANDELFNMETFFSGYGTEIVKDTDGPMLPPCGTTACYAGFISLRVAPKGSKVINGYIIGPDGSKAHAEDYARRALDLTTDQCDTLFFLKGIEQVERAVKYLVANPDADGDALWAGVVGDA